MGKWGYILLSIWLILTGLISISNFNVYGISSILPILSLVAGILIFVEGFRSRFRHNFGGLFLSIWLIVAGLLPITRLHVSSSILAAVAIAAGILLLLKR